MICLAFQTVVCAQYPTEFGANGEYGGSVSLNESSAAENIFYVDAHPFVLLDKDSEGNYFVIADEYYGKGGFAYTSGGDMTNPQKFDINGATSPENRVNAAVYINSEAFCDALPGRIYDNIITYDWTVEAAENFNGYSSYYNSGKYTISETYDAAYDITAPYTQSCKIALPSKTELFKYQHLIGYSIAKSSTCLPYVTGSSDPTAWLLRTPLYTGAAGSRNDQAEKIKMTDGASSSTRDLSNALRPVFFLDKDFFKTTVIDSTGAGSVVKEEILACVGGDTDKLTEIGYSLGDLINMGLIDADDSIMPENARLSYTKAVPGYTLEASYDFPGEEDESGTMLRWHISDDGTDWRVIAGESGRAYTIKNADAGKYIKASVRIKTNDGKYTAETDTPCVNIGAALQSPSNSVVSRIEGHQADTPAEYIIALQSGTKLSLLDCVSTHNGYEYFVTTNESSGSSPTKTAVFDPNDDKSVAYALETFMYKSTLTDTEWASWSGNSAYTCTALDGEIKKHMLLHEFVTEASASAGAENDYVAKAHIALMSYGEFLRYYDRFGYYISAGNYWLLRTARPDGKLMVVDNTTSDPTKNGRIAAGGVGSAYKIRPVFYLDGDFFAKVRLNVEQTGAAVKQTILQNYTREQLAACGYTDEELNAFGFESVKAENPAFDGAFEAGQRISVRYTYTNSNTAAEKNQKYEWFRSRSKTGVYEKIEGVNSDSYTLTDADVGSYIKVVITPYTSFMTGGTPAELVSGVPVRTAPEYIVDADITVAESVTADISVKKLSEGEGSVILLLAVFDGEGKLADLGINEVPVSEGGNIYAVTASGGSYMKVMVIDNLTAARPLFAKAFPQQPAASVTALEQLTVTKDRVSGAFNVSGKIDGTEYKPTISIIVTDAEGDIAYADYAQTADGSFGAVFYMPESASSGTYRLTVGSYDALAAKTADFYYVSKEEKEQLIAQLQEDISNGVSKAEFVQKVKDNKDVLELENAASAPVSEAKLELVYGDLYDYIRANGTGDSFADSYYRCLSVYAFSGSSRANIAAVLAEFAGYYAFDKEGCYPITQNKWFSAAALNERLAGNACASLAEIRSLYNEQAFLEGIHSADDYNQVMRLFADYAEYVSVDKSYYNKLGATTASVKIVGKSFESIAALEKQLKSLYSDTGSSGGSSGGGGSSPGGISVSADAYAQLQQEKSYAAFNDLSDALWAAEAIEYLAGRGVVSGYEDGAFRPNETLTREAFTKMIVDAKGLLDSAAECDYTDVGGDFWAYRYIASAKNNAIVSGMGDGTFGRGMPVTRQDMAVMLARAAGFDGGNGDLADFAEVSDYAKASVSCMKQNGVINGYEDGTFRPKANATRAEAAKIIYDMLMGGML